MTNKDSGRRGIEKVCVVNYKNPYPTHFYKNPHKKPTTDHTVTS